MNQPAELSKREFAALQGYAPSWVTQLERAGRLVLSADGRRVRVAESIQRIADTADPQRAGQRAQNAAARAEGPALADGQPGTAAAAEAPADGGAEPFAGKSDADLQIRRARAQAEREEALARKALREEAEELGQLLRAADVRHAEAEAATLFRQAFENLPHTLAPLCAAEMDEHRCRVLLADAFEQALAELSRRLGAAAGPPGA
ncbi:MAG: hypothetical protein ACRC2X_15500 [Giesbergeria sp.]